MHERRLLTSQVIRKANRVPGGKYVLVMKTYLARMSYACVQFPRSLNSVSARQEASSMDRGVPSPKAHIHTLKTFTLNFIPWWHKFQPGL